MWVGFFESVDDFLGVICREGCLHEVDEFLGIVDLQVWNVRWGLDDLDGVGRFAAGSDDFLVVGVSDEEDLVSLLGVADGLGVDFGDQWACGIDGGEVSRLGLGPNVRADAVGTKDDDGSLGHLIEVFDKRHAAAGEAAYDVFVVDDFVVDVDWSVVEEVQDLIDNIDGHVDTGTEAAGIGEDEMHDSPNRSAWGTGAGALGAVPLFRFNTGS